MALRRTLWAAALVLLTGCSASGSTGSHPVSSSAQAPSSHAPSSQAPAGASPAWTTYQNGPSRLGDAAPQPALAPTRLAWRQPLDGAAVYGQPLLADGRVVVATEADDVYALDPRDGRIEWTVNVGSPLTNVAAKAGCGDVDPLGITSTPVIDPAAGTLYVVAEVSGPGRGPVHHQLVGLDLATGRQILSVDADPPLPPGEEPLNLLQRAALALGNGRVYIGYGGQFGDCGTYHGWVVAVPVTGGAPATSFDVTPQSTGGAVWQGGAAPSLDPAGNVYVSTGNPNSGGPHPWAEAALKLPAGLNPVPEAYFQDRAATGDLDLSAGTPVLLPDGTVFAAGKADVGYVLRQSDLSQVGTVGGTVCGSDPDGGAAYDPANDSLYLPCRDGGLQQIELASRATGWRAGGVNSTPVLANGELWALQYPSGRLQEIDPASGRVLESVSVGRSVPTFASPAVVDGLILVPTTAGVVALAGPLSG